MTMTGRDVTADRPLLQRAAAFLGIIGGGTGIALGIVATARGAVDSDAHGAGIFLAVSMLLAAIVGLVCGLLYLRGLTSMRVALVLMVAGAWHIASSPVVGMVSGLLLLFAGMCALMYAEEQLHDKQRHGG